MKSPEKMSKKHELILAASISIIIAVVGALVLMSIQYGRVCQKTEDFHDSNMIQMSEVKEQLKNADNKLDSMQEQNNSLQGTVLVLIQKINTFGEQQARMEEKLDSMQGH